MADAMQGVMSLAPEMMGQRAASRSYLTPEDEATLTQLRNSVSPQEFSKEMFTAAEQADPQAVAKLKRVLSGIQLPQELIDLMQEMVDVLLQQPDQYAQNRKELIAEGVPEELLPPQFDPMYLMALNMALDQISAPVIQGFARGGMVKNPISAGIASLGRGGDRMLAHITPREARMLMRMGGSGTINPVTGLPEFFLGGLAKAVGGAFKSVAGAVVGGVKGAAGFISDAAEAIGDTVKSVASAAKDFVSSPIGKVVTSVAIGFFLGPAAASYFGISSAAGVAAISGFLGGAGSTLLSGGSLQDALKVGAIGGVTAGAFAGVTGGAEAFKAGSYTGPTTVSESWKKATESLLGKPPVDATTGIPSSVADDVAAAADETAALTRGQVQAAGGAGSPVPAGGAGTYPNPDGTFTVTRFDAAGRPISTSIEGTAAVRSAGQAVDDGIGSLIEAKASLPSGSQTFGLGRAGPIPGAETPSLAAGRGFPTTASPAGLPSASTTFELGRAGPVPGGDIPNLAAGRALPTVPAAPPVPAGPAPQTGMFDIPEELATQPYDKVLDIPVSSAIPVPRAPEGAGIMDLVKQGEYTEAVKKAAGNVYDYFSPGVRETAQNREALNIYRETIAQTGNKELAVSLAEKALPGFTSTYGPLIGLGLAGAYIGGAFTPPPPPKPDIPTSGTELYKEDPYLLLPNISSVSASTGLPYGGASTYSASTGTPYSYYASGGIASLKNDASKFPRKVGPIDGPGTGTSDSIPAMLSDGEFVFTAKAVRAMGNGSRRKGAKRMYALMKALEKRA